MSNNTLTSITGVQFKYDQIRKAQLFKAMKVFLPKIHPK